MITSNLIDIDCTDSVTRNVFFSIFGPLQKWIFAQHHKKFAKDG